MSSVEIRSPAKVNLGLEILGKRPDGYHEIRTVMAMIDLADRLTVFVDDRESNGLVEGVAPADNLIRRALDMYRQRVPESPRLGWSIDKQIPAAAGLGGASSNAAAALLCANHLASTPLSLADLHDLAAALGSDIPFFLQGPVALATGRGTDITPLPTVDGDLLIVVPNVQTEGKTASMYAMLRAEDFGDGAVQQESSKAGSNPELAQIGLDNAFTRAAQERWPVLREVWSLLEQSGASRFTLSGAGPSTLVLTDDRDQARSLEQELRRTFPGTVQTFVTRFRRDPLHVIDCVSHDG